MTAKRDKDNKKMMPFMGCVAMNCDWNVICGYSESRKKGSGL
jgi:hypothetical protein